MRLKSLLSAIALLAQAGCGGAGQGSEVPPGPIGLTTSLPILWRETGDLAGLLDKTGERNWVLEVLDDHGAVRPVDDLAGEGGVLPLPPRSLLVMAQPRPLAPQENVALDDWVRAGGRVLLFADPMLTADSSFSLGDRRRPQDVVLLSPILSRWGLELQFDDEQQGGEREVTLFGQAVPVNLPGQFALSQGKTDCALLGNGVAARCRIGKGVVLALADCAVLEDVPPEDRENRQAALETLVDRAMKRESAEQIRGMF